MSNTLWFQQEMALFWITGNQQPVYMQLTSIKRMTWKDETHVSVFLEGILPLASALLKIGKDPTDDIAILWNECGARDRYEADWEVMRLMNCKVCFRRIKNITSLYPENQETMKVEVKLDCQLNVIDVGA